MTALGLAGCAVDPAQDLGEGDSVVVDRYFDAVTDKIDFLFVLDNSPSAAAHHPIWEDAIVEMLRRMLEGECHDRGATTWGEGGALPFELDDSVRVQSGDYGTHFLTDDGEQCPPGTEHDYPVRGSVHVGFITTSVAGPQGEVCGPGSLGFHPHQADNAHFLGSTRGVTGNEFGFLRWEYPQPVEPFLDQVRSHLESLEANGCPFPAPLEATYRFLNDPEPPETWFVDARGRAEAVGVDDTLLRARREFLRPLGRLVVSHVTPNDDCSLMSGSPQFEGGQTGFQLTREGTPSDCYLKDEQGAKDPRYPMWRYLQGLSSAEILDRAGESVSNPLMAAEDGPPRDPGTVQLVSIAGVPWEDIAETRTSPTEHRWRYETSHWLESPTVQVNDEVITPWTVLLGQHSSDPQAPWCSDDDPPASCGRPFTPPLSPFMIQAREARTGTDPISGESTVPPGEPHATEFEPEVEAGDGLQPACRIWQHGEEPEVVAQAIPGQRLFQLARLMGDAAPASICPPLIDPAFDWSGGYGFNGVLDYVEPYCSSVHGDAAICLQEAPLVGDDEPQLYVLEAQAGLDCGRSGRSELPRRYAESLRDVVCRQGPLEGRGDCDKLGICLVEPLHAGIAEPNTCAQPQFDDEVGYCLESAEWCSYSYTKSLRVVLRGDYRSSMPSRDSVYFAVYVPDRAREVDVPPIEF